MARTLEQMLHSETDAVVVLAWERQPRGTFRMMVAPAPGAPDRSDLALMAKLAEILDGLTERACLPPGAIVVGAGPRPGTAVLSIAPGVGSAADDLGGQGQ